jgi:hypothetical protein
MDGVRASAAVAKAGDPGSGLGEASHSSSLNRLLRSPAMWSILPCRIAQLRRGYENPPRYLGGYGRRMYCSWGRRPRSGLGEASYNCYPRRHSDRGAG